MLPETRILASGGFGVLAFDWPGDGASEGDIRWGDGERQALAAAVDWLSSRSDVAPEKIGGLGFSMGAYMMAQGAASDTRLRAVVLEAAPAAFSEYLYYAHRREGWLSELPALWAVRFAGMPLNEMLPRNVVRTISPRPVFILGGDIDTTVPRFMTRELYESALEPKTLWIVQGAKHGGYADIAPKEYAARLLAFFNHALID